jgi:uncharacterized membrane protein required for colicin V production
MMEILTKLNWVDLLIIILMLRTSYVAFQDGLSHELFPLIGSVVITVVGLRYYTQLSTILSQNMFNAPRQITDFLAFMLLVVVTGILFKLFKALADRIIKVEWHPLLERFGGLFVGVAKAAIVTSLVIITLSLAPLPYLQWSIRDKSLMGMPFLKIGPAIYEKVSRILPEVKIGTPSVDKEGMVRNLSSDKAVAPKAGKK